MRHLGFAIISILLAVPLWASAAPVVSTATLKTEVASPEADQWAAAQKKAAEPAAAPDPAKVTPPPSAPEAAKAAEPATLPAPAATPSPAPSAAGLPGMQPAAPVKKYVPRPGLNEMQGKILSKSSDPKTLRVLVDGGFNVEFTWDAQTTMINGGSPITMDDLEYGDVVLVRYSGMDLNAVEIDRTSKVPRPQ